MASTVLPNGIIIPEKYSRDWYADLYHNWQELDNLLGGGTPKDGTLTIQKNGTTVGTFSANQATNETINITVPDVNDATLTIQKNGTTVDIFTANSSTDKTVDITVPTKTSDLTNDSGFITSDDTKIPLAGSNQISGSLIPATTNTYNLGSNSKRFANVYASPRAGIHSHRINNDFTIFSGGLTENDASTIWLYSELYSVTSLQGAFQIKAKLGSTTKTLQGKPNGTLTWGNKNIDCIEEQGTGYIRYTNGIQICWGAVTNNNNIDTGKSIYTLPKAFNNSSYSLILTAQSNDVHYTSVMENSPGGTVYKTNTQFGVFFCDRTMNLINELLTCGYIAIGSWK